MSLCSLGLSCEPVKNDHIKYCEHGRIPITCEWCVIVDLIKRVEKMEEIWNRCSEDNPIQAIEERFKELEKYISLIKSIDNNRNDWKSGYQDLKSEISQLCHKVNDLYHLREKNDYNKPHKCPVCDGSGKLILYSTLTYPAFAQCAVSIDSEGNVCKKCNACEGHGIIWG